MAYYCNEPSHTFSEYLLIPTYSSENCVPSNVSLRTPLCKFKRGEQSPLSINFNFSLYAVSFKRQHGYSSCP